MFRELEMNEMMDLNGGYLAPSERPGTSSFERDRKNANSDARTTVIGAGAFAGAVICGAAFAPAAIAAAIAVGVDKLSSRIPSN